MNQTQAPIHVLIVDAEASSAFELANLLVAEGYVVVGPAASGPQALALLRQHHVDLLLCDTRPQGLWDGIETAQRLAAEHPVPLIYLTAMVDWATLHRAMATAPAAYLAKPVSLASLRAAIEVALAGRRPATEPEQPPTPSRSGETILRLDQHIFLKHNYRYVRLALSDIVLLEADNTVTTLVTTGPHYSLRLSLTAALERLSYPRLVRVHRSFAINLHHVSTFSDTEATLHDQTVPLSRQYKAAFLRQFQYS